MSSLFKPAEKKKLKLRLAVTGPSGSGKTFSALKIATGLVGQGGRICVIDTENNSASLYADKFNFDVGVLIPPYTPEKFTEYLHAAESAGYDCVIMDSISHEWRGAGGVLSIHSESPTKNSYVAWNKITPRHDLFLQSIISSSVHVIVTMRSKQGYVLEQIGGKQVPTKVGLEPIQREGTEYEFTAVLDMDLGHHAQCSKDRTQLFDSGNPFIPDETTGIQLAEWLESGAESDIVSVGEYIQKIHGAKDLDALGAVFQEINSKKKMYSRDEIREMISAKDAAKEKLMSAPGQSATPPTPPPEKKTAPTPDATPPPPKQEKIVTPGDWIKGLRRRLDTQMFAAAIDKLIEDNTYSLHEFNKIIADNDEGKAADACDAIDALTGGGNG